MGQYDPIEEGDNLSAATLDTKFTALEGAANNIDAVSHRTFDHYHGTHSLVEPNIAFDTGARFMGHAANPLPQHELELDPAKAYKHEYTYGGPQNAVWPGPAQSTIATGSTGVGWRVIGDSLHDPFYGQDKVQGRSDAKLECTLTGTGLLLAEPGEGLTLGEVGGVLVLLNVETLFFENQDSKPQCAGLGPSQSQEWIKFRARFVLQVKVRKHDGADIGWINLKKSHRALSMPSSGMAEDSNNTSLYPSLEPGFATSHHRTVRGAMWKDISIRTLITNDDLSAAGLDYGVAGTALAPGRLRLQGVRAVVSLEIPGVGVASSSNADLTDNAEEGVGIVLKAYSMTTLVLSSEYKV